MSDFSLSPKHMGVVLRTALPSLFGQVGLIKSIQSYPAKNTQSLCVSDQAVTTALHYTTLHINLDHHGLHPTYFRLSKDPSLF